MTTTEKIQAHPKFKNLPNNQQKMYVLSIYTSWLDECIEIGKTKEYKDKCIYMVSKHQALSEIGREIFTDILKQATIA